MTLPLPTLLRDTTPSYGNSALEGGQPEKVESLGFYCFNKGKKQLPVEAFNYIQIALLFCFSPFSSSAKGRGSITLTAYTGGLLLLSCRSKSCLLPRAATPETPLWDEWKWLQYQQLTFLESTVLRTSHRSSWHCLGQFPGSSQSLPWSSKKKPGGVKPPLPQG